MGEAVEKPSYFSVELALKLSEKKQLEYSIVIHWLRAKLSFNLLRSAVLCVRASSRVGRLTNPGLSKRYLTYLDKKRASALM